MILAIRYTVKGVKKGYKKYKVHQAEKEANARGDLPDLHDPSRELDSTCQAELRRDNSLDSTSSSDSTLIAEKALENDPEFQKYMERHRSLYLERHQGLPPSYDTTITNGPMMHSPVSNCVHSAPAVSNQAHCMCHNCLALMHSQNSFSTSTPSQSHTQELPASTSVPAELDAPKESSSETPANHPIVFEVPGDFPAIVPEKKSDSVSELPAIPT